jgi:hypothetical protein
MHASNFPDHLDSVGEAQLIGDMSEVVMFCLEVKEVVWVVEVNDLSFFGLQLFPCIKAHYRKKLFPCIKEYIFLLSCLSTFCTMLCPVIAVQY